MSSIYDAQQKAQQRDERIISNAEQLLDIANASKIGKGWRLKIAEKAMLMAQHGVTQFTCPLCYFTIDYHSYDVINTDIEVWLKSVSSKFTNAES